MKIALAQINYHIGHFDSNVLKIKNAIQKAKQKDVDLIVFAEMAVSGYPPRDFLEFDDFIQKCYQAIKEIAQQFDGLRSRIVAWADVFSQKLSLEELIAIKKIRTKKH